ncbi:site-specific integrase, partial [Pontiellaceae bacterium B12219]|nr:site-specific integrase [Pontiellaceae bacterium B12219]
VKRKYGTYQAKIRIKSTDPILYRSLDTKNKLVALKRLDDLYNRLELEQEGLIDSEKITKSKQDSILLHLSRYISDLEVTASNENYVEATANRLRKLFKECKWSRLNDINPGDFIEWRKHHFYALSIKTLNEYYSRLNSFVSWLYENGNLSSNPVSKIKRIPLRGRTTFKRRSLTETEIKNLLDAAPEDRKQVYIFALSTGLRRKEISNLEAADFDKETNTLLLRGELTKNGLSQKLMLHREPFEILSHVTKGKEPTEKIFHVPHIDTFKSDLKKAGIEIFNSRREKVDFHALRHTFCTRLGRAGISPQIAKSLMRHSDMSTTQNYTDSGNIGIVEALNMVPAVATNTATKGGQTATKPSEKEALNVVKKLAQMLGLEATALEKEWCSGWDSNP